MKFSTIRLLETGYNNAVFNMAVDEVLMNELEVSATSSPKGASSDPKKKEKTLLGAGLHNSQFFTPSAVLRIYGWRPAAVSIGYFQSMELEVKVNECRRKGIDVVRRITGGGAVYHEQELTYSFVTNFFASDVLQSYISICNPVVESIRRLGFDARFAPLNDIVIENGVKVSGNAQTRRKNVLLQHGTILLDVNVEKMFSVLKVPSEKLRDKLISDVKKRVKGLNRPFDEVATILKTSFSEAFNSSLLVDTLTQEECNMVDTLTREKYSLDSWNWRR